MSPDEISARVAATRGTDQAALDRLIRAGSGPVWQPEPGNAPQIAAYHSAADILRMGREADVVIGPIMDADDIAAHPQVAALGNIIHVPAEDGHLIAMPGVFPRIAGVKAEITHAGGAAGAHSDMLLARLGLTAKEIDALRQSGAVWA